MDCSLSLSIEVVMGTKACTRAGCENILCDRYSNKFGYLCDECFEELTYAADLSEGYIRTFLSSQKGSKELANAKVTYLECVFIDQRKLQHDH